MEKSSDHIATSQLKKKKECKHCKSEFNSRLKVLTLAG